MKTIVDLLKSDEVNSRVSVGDVWMYWGDESKVWVVLHQKRYARRPTVIIETIDESAAVQAFCRASGMEVVN